MGQMEDIGSRHCSFAGARVETAALQESSFAADTGQTDMGCCCSHTVAAVAQEGCIDPVEYLAGTDSFAEKPDSAGLARAGCLAVGVSAASAGRVVKESAMCLDAMIGPAAKHYLANPSVV